MINDKFKIRIKKHEESILKYIENYNMVGNIRMIIIVLFAYCIYMTIKFEFYIPYTLGSFFSFLVFIALVKYHKKISDNIKFAKEIININKKYLSRIDGSWVDFNDIGEEFIDKSHRYSWDLDVFGKNSLFQLINITNTLKGRNDLAKSLLEPNYNKEEIILRQRAIDELHNKLDLCEQIEYTTGKYKKYLKNPQNLIKYVQDDNVLIKSKKIKNIVYYIPLVTMPILVGIIAFKVQQLYILVIAIIIIQFLIFALRMGKTNYILEDISYFKYNLETYSHILKLIEKEDFKSDKLKSIKLRLFNENYSAIKAIKELDGILGKANLRYNGMLYIILNGLFLWDYQCVFSLEAWKIKYGYRIVDCLDAIGEIEELMSLSVLMNINNEICFPTIENSKLIVEAKTLGHPLINSGDRVVNDLDMCDNIFIITGSNMSGKTTFLRTIGVNLVLAYSGAVVCAEEMRCSILSISTSMRITDDLRNGVSTFYAELIRIKDIINYSSEKKETIFLIDEIFRGTNSIDRIIGAKNVLANLNNAKIIGALTTHDLELCTLDKYSRIKNYHFSEYYKDEKIFFDYKMKEGKSITTNAKYLMNIVGIKILEE